MRRIPLACTVTWIALGTLSCARDPATATVGAPSSAPRAAASASAAASGRVVPKATRLGTVRGRVRIEGDKPPMRDAIRAEIPDECAAARDFFGPLFRRGPDGALADALVAVTGYREDPPPRRPTESVVAEGCRWDRRTVALATNQKIAVSAKDRVGYVPTLLRTYSPVTMVPVPGGSPVELTPPKPGWYTMVDSAHTFIRAEVFVVAYPTFDVTGVDGRFEIPNVPAGPVKINALLPTTMATTERALEVRANEVVEVELTLTFDASAPRPGDSAAPSPSASGAPAAAGSAAPRR